MAANKLNSRVARLVLTRLAWLVGCAMCCSAWAGRAVQVYEVEAKGAQSPASIQDAMREVLVRATGRRESATDPAFATLVSEAQNYVKGFTPAGRGPSQVIFDGAAVERAIVAAGRNVWDGGRPFTLVVLYPPLARAAEDSARVELDHSAIARGLPITVVPLSLVDASGNDLTHDALMGLAQRYGGDAVLVGRADTGTASGQLRWTLHTNAATQSWTGPLSAGIDGAVDTLAPAQGGSLAQIESSARVEIGGVTNLVDYASVQRLLESVPGVRRATIAAANGNTVIFDVLARGGGDALGSSLPGVAHLSRADNSDAHLAYQYRP